MKRTFKKFSDKNWLMLWLMVTWDIMKFGRFCLGFSILDGFDIFNKNFTQKHVVGCFPAKKCALFDALKLLIKCFLYGLMFTWEV
jgi:hypothetical protein